MEEKLVYVAEEKPTSATPTTWLWQSIVCTCLCCTPLGIVGIVFAALCYEAINRNDRLKAEEYSRKAKMWTTISFIIGIVFYIIYFLSWFMFGVSLFNNYSYYY